MENQIITSGLSKDNVHSLNRKYAKSLAPTIAREARWLSQSYEKPQGIPESECLDDLQKFKDIIWEHPADSMIESYGHTPSELAILCGENSNGWLMSSHIHFLLDKLNCNQNRCLNIVGNYVTKDEVGQLVKRMGQGLELERVNVVLNVGKDVHGSVFISSMYKSGTHWVLASLDLTSNPTVLYCDSLGWNSPTNLLEYLSKFSSIFGIVRLERLVKMHDPTGTGHIHHCTEHCRNYPLQTCSNVCGLVAVVCAVIFALDKSLFQTLCGAKCFSKIFVHYPTRFEKFLRRLIIHWFLSDNITTTFLYQKTTSIVLDHSYADAVLNRASKLTKRKIPVSEPSVPPKVHIKNMNTKLECQEKGKYITNAELNANYDCALPAESLRSLKQDVTEAKNMSTITKHQSPPKKNWICTICNMNLSCKQSLFKHKKRKHNYKPSFNRSCSCHCNECSFVCKTIIELITHYNKIHDKAMTISSKQFENDEQFMEWKKDMERKTLAQYFIMRGIETAGDCQVSYYYCRRSGKKPVVHKPDRKRAQKSQGSCKINNNCTSFLKVRKHLTNSSISVQYCLDHCGHSSDLGHLKISNDIRYEIAGKLSQGLGPSKVLEMIRDNISTIDRDSLVTCKDINNIKHQYNISQNHRHKEDGQSVYIWVKDLEKEKDHNPILFYKPQNEEYEGLNINDFLICIQTKFQKDTMLKYGSKIVCVDSTHCTTQYDFLLITLFVIDDFEEAIPIAWAISNKEDSRILNIFMSRLRHSCGIDLKTNIFMSDMADNFYLAWCTSFSQPYKRIYCSWHVDRCWKNKINACIKNDSTKVNVYTALKMLQNETNENQFRNLLPKCISYLDQEAENFCSYFVENYVYKDKVLLWAGCFRLGTPANTNMYAESFHNVLKSTYFHRKQNRRVDDLLITLLKISRDKNIEQIIKLEKGKVTHRIREARARHKASLNIVGIDKVSETEWIVPSSDKSKNYNVCLVMKAPCSCKLTCNSCFVCTHMYTCTCTDFLLRSLSCKHIHAVHRDRNITEACKVDIDDFEKLETLKSFVNKNEKVNDGQRQKEMCIKKIYDIIQLVQATDDNNVHAVRAILEGLNKTYATGCGLQKYSYVEKLNIEKTQSFASNKLFENQMRFVSTKKKYVRGSKLKLKRPDNKEKEHIEKAVLSAPANVCALCYSTVDKNCDSGFFKCTCCNCLVHFGCDLSIEYVEAKEKLCSSCRI